MLARLPTALHQQPDALAGEIGAETLGAGHHHAVAREEHQHAPAREHGEPAREGRERGRVVALGVGVGPGDVGQEQRHAREALAPVVERGADAQRRHAIRLDEVETDAVGDESRGMAHVHRRGAEHDALLLREDRLGHELGDLDRRGVEAADGLAVVVARHRGPVHPVAIGDRRGEFEIVGQLVQRREENP